MGAIFASAAPSRSVRLDSWRDWLRLFHPQPPVTIKDQQVDYPNHGDLQMLEGYPLAVIKTGDKLTLLASLISPLSHWRLVTAQHIDKSGRILCVGEHNGQLSWCMLVPRGVDFRLPGDRS